MVYDINFKKKVISEVLVHDFVYQCYKTIPSRLVILEIFQFKADFQAKNNLH